MQRTIVRFLCRCNSCYVTKSVLSDDLETETCPVCGSGFDVDIKYHPEHPRAVTCVPAPAPAIAKTNGHNGHAVELGSGIVAPTSQLLDGAHLDDEATELVRCSTCEDKRELVVATRAGVKHLPCPDCVAAAT